MPQPATTVLDADFAEKLADPELNWPSAAEQAAARDASTGYARLDTVRWLTELLAPEYWPFPAESDPPMVRDPLGHLRPRPPDSAPAALKYQESLTPAVSGDGEDLLCARWTTPAYRFQFIGGQQLMRLSVEPIRAGPRGPITPEEAASRTEHSLRKLLADSGRRLNYCAFDSEPKPYGYLVRVRCLDLGAWPLQFADDPLAPRQEWVLGLIIHTDGTSYVIDVLPMLAANVVAPPGAPLTRWFHAPRPRAPATRPTTAPAVDPAVIEARLRALDELLRRQREQQKQP
jgi:hypothetical protein